MSVDKKAPKRTLAFYNRLGIWVALLFISLGLCVQSLQVNLFAQASLDKEYAQAMAQQISHSLRLKLSATQDQQSQAAQNPNTIAYLSEPDLSWKRTLKSLIPNAEQIFILNTMSALGLSEKLGYAAQALVSSTLKGKQHPLEAVQREGKIRFYLASPIKDYSQEVIGVLLIEYGDEWLNHLRSGAIAKHGLISTRQVLRDQPEQGITVFEVGKKSDSQLTVVTESINDYWFLTFIPADTRPQLALTTIIFPWVLALLGTLITLFIITALQKRVIDRNKLLLYNYVRQLYRQGESEWPKFNLRIFHELAKAMEHLFDPNSAKSDLADNSASNDELEFSTREKPPVREKQRVELVQKVIKPKTTIGTNSVSQASSMPQVVLEELDDSPTIEVPQHIFRSYDIRGTTDEISPSIAHEIGRALGSEILARDNDKIVLARDGRLSSPELAQALQQGLLASGCDVINIGTATTGCLYYACHELETKNGIVVTGSHNADNINGFKIVLNQKTLSKEQLQALYHRIQRQEFNHGQGQVSELNLHKSYIERIQSDIQLSRPIKVVLDAGNGIAGPIGLQLLKTMGLDVIPLYCEVNGHFPNHLPNPGDPKNLTALQAAVKEHQADIGIAFDGDGDRIAVMDEKGTIISPDRVLMLLAKDVISRQPGCDIVYDIKSSNQLNTLITQFGGRPTMWKTGHSLIKEKMLELDAVLGGELSGHFYFRDRWYGFDDALYASARLLELISHQFDTVSQMFAEFPDNFATPELTVDIDDTTSTDIIKKLSSEPSLKQGARVSTIDGIRSDFNDGWGLVRLSNSSHKLTMRFEGIDQAALDRIQQLFKAALVQHGPNLKLPF